MVNSRVFEHIFDSIDFLVDIESILSLEKYLIFSVSNIVQC